MKPINLKPILFGSILIIFGTSSFAQIFELDTSIRFLNRDSRSANWVDINGDSWIDIYITNGKSGGQNNEAYINNGNGTFTILLNDSIVKDNSSSDGATWADTDGQPGLELFVANWYNQYNLFYRDTNQSTRVLISGADPANNLSYSETGSFGDYDQDGYVDLLVTNSAVNKRNDLFKNNGDGTFSRITNSPVYQSQLTSRGVSWVDIDNDGDVDLYITNENNEKGELFENNNGSFIAITNSAIAQFNGNAMSSCWGDYDNDGDLDVFISIYGGNNRLFRNDGNFSFTEITGIGLSNGGLSFSANWGDIDNDGDLDLVVGNAFSSGSTLKSYLYLNNGNGTFTRNQSDTLTKILGWTYGNAFGDFDKDGDLDLLHANCFNANQKNALFKNKSSQQVNPNNWIVLEAKGVNSNHSAIGARISIKSTINGQAIWQIREISAQSSYCGQNMLAAHFGLANATIVDSLIIRWPNGLTEAYTNLASNSYIQLIEGQGTSTSINNPGKIQNDMIELYPIPASDFVTIKFQTGNSSQVQISLLNSVQQTIYSIDQITSATNLFEQKIKLPENLASGTYFIKVQVDNDAYLKKFLVE